MTTFVAIYRGQTIGEAKLIAVSADSSVVAQISKMLLKNVSGKGDEITCRFERGRKSALRLIYEETKLQTNHERG